MRAAAPAALLANARICALANPIVVAAGAPVIRPFPFVVVRQLHQSCSLLPRSHHRAEFPHLAADGRCPEASLHGI
uniref:Secreted protein n=1 Tax=Triticum urartu TaxID=4572 RepID=A0A8R7NZX7_TRIUA